MLTLILNFFREKNMKKFTLEFYDKELEVQL